MSEVFGTNYERQIFSYSDGQKTVSADPMRLKGELHRHAQQMGISIDKCLDHVEKGDEDEATEAERLLKWESVLALADLVAVVFEIQEPYVGNGKVDVVYAMSLLAYFLEYLEKKNPMLVWRPTLSPSTESPTTSPSPTSAATSAA